MEPFYRLIFKRAFVISWKNKWLWIFGFFAAVIGNGSVYEALLRGFSNLSQGGTIFDTLREYAESGVLGMVSLTKLSALWQTDASAFAINIFTILLLLCVLAILISFGVIGQGGVLEGVIRTAENKKISFKENLKVGLARFWPILELNVIMKVVALGILFLIIYLVSMVVFESAALNLVLYTLSFIVFLVFGIIIYFVTIYAVAYAVLREQGAFDALKSAWRLFKRHVLLNLEMGIMLFVLNVAVALAFFIAMFIVLSPFFMLYFLWLFAGGLIGPKIILALIMIIFLVAMVLVGAWWSTLQLGVWAILFEELAVKGGKSKIIRVFEHVIGRIKRRR
ncbi:hypothetical protein HZB94_03375 [Candidatus Falkowbacteria bacterium]|nr:hypothetical protein [Candidatus Falkowbacteria bacterium]